MTTHFHTGQPVRLTAAFLEASPEFAMVTRAKVLEDPGNGAVRFKWFPGAQEVAEFLAPRARRVREFEGSLRRVAFCRLVEPEPRPEPSQAEREAVAAALASIGIRPAPDFQRPERTVEEQIAAIREEV